MQLVGFLLKRCLFPKESSLLAFSLWVSVAGVALGIVQLMVVLAVMSGFQQLFQENYTRISSEMIVIPRRNLKATPQFAADLRRIPGIAAATPTALGQGMVLKGNGVGGVVLEGVDLPASRAVTPWEKIWLKEPLPAPAGTPWIWIGKQLADKLHIEAGETVNVMIAEGQRRRVVPFFVAAITKFGIYDHDLHYASVSLQTVFDLFQKGEFEPLYKTKVSSGFEIAHVADSAQTVFDGLATVKPWSEINQNVFLAVGHQKLMLFLVLEIIVALAAMNVVNLLMMSSHHRRRDTAILRAMGMKLRHVLWFFVGQGAAVGFAGILLGVGLGYAACAFIERFQPTLLSESIYNVSRLPLRVQIEDVGMVCGVGFLVCIVFSLIPALGAALARPVKALRYE